jgi:antitoxin component of MazEF toxin-antitoxin module
MTLRGKVTAAGDCAAIILPRELLELAGLEIGQEVDLSVTGQALIIRPAQEAERTRTLSPAADRVFERRHELLTRLAGDTGTDDSLT